MEATYPKNAYIDIFGFEEVYLPQNAEELSGNALKIELFDSYGEINTVSPQESEIFLLRYKENMTFLEIAKRKGITEDSVRQIFLKVLRKMRNPFRNKELRAC